MNWDTSCKDWETRIKEGRSLVPELPLNKPYAVRALTIFNMLRLPDVPDNPSFEDASGQWTKDMVAALFGSYDEKKKLRHIRELFCLVPKKNSKTTNGAAIMLTALLMNERPRAEFLIVAPSHDVASLAYSQLVGMIEIEPVLKAKFYIQDHIKKITYIPSGAFIKVKSFDPSIVTGSKPAGVLLDEVHVIAEHSQADRVLGQLRGGLISQPEGFLLSITTQSERRPSGVFKSELKKARMVRDGLLSAPILPVLYEFPKNVDPLDVKNWHMVTPNRGLSITVERLLPDFQQAQAGGDHELKRWLSQHLNVEIGESLFDDGWVGREFWAQCIDKEPVTLDRILQESEVVCVGIDGGGLDDLLGLAVIGRRKSDGMWLLWTHAWAHPSVLARNKQHAQRLMDFEKDGDLTIVKVHGEDVDGVAEICKRIKDANLLYKIGADPLGLGAITEGLEGAGIEEGEIIGISQGWRMTGTIKNMERKLSGKGIIHSGTGMMDWVINNAKIEPRTNGSVMSKAKSGSYKIDPLMASLNAVSLMELNPEPVEREYQFFVV